MRSSCVVAFVLVVFGSGVFLGGCSSSAVQNKIPEGILSVDSMVSVLVDLQILEAGIDLNLVSVAADQHSSNHYYAVFKDHHITRAQYDSSMSYYSAHPEILSKVYEKSIAGLSEKQAKLVKH